MGVLTLAKITNEFKFNIASFHHAHEAYLVPDVLKKTLVHISDNTTPIVKEPLTRYGGTPTIAIFAVTGGYDLNILARFKGF